MGAYLTFAPMTGRGNPSHYRGMTSYLTSELTRLLHNVLAFGTIAEVNHATAQVRLDINGRLTAWLPAPAVITQNYRSSFHLFRDATKYSCKMGRAPLYFRK